MHRKIVLTLALICAATVPVAGQVNPNTLTPAEKAAGWRLLFDGISMDGWRGYRGTGVPPSWKVEEGLLKTIPKARGGDIITVDEFDDFELSWEWKIARRGNNGIKYFVTEQRPEAPGHEYQIMDDAANEDRLHGPLRATASFYDVLPPSPGVIPKPAGEWNISRVLVRGTHVEHWLNGKKALEYELGSEKVKSGLAASKFKNFPDFGTKIRGHVMLTYHSDECWFRNIKIREIPLK